MSLKKALLWVAYWKSIDDAGPRHDVRAWPKNIRILDSVVLSLFKAQQPK